MFILTSLLVAIRYGISRKNNPHHFYLPFMAALSVSPIVTPLVLFAQEIIGTTRVLQFIHPMSSKSVYADEGNVNKDIISKPIQLFSQYIVHGLCARLGLPSSVFFRMKGLNLIDFPPISMCLFEKLGNVTAASFIDDELICDPELTPEQLLIPSSSGLKLFDLFPKQDDIEEELSDPDDVSAGDKSNSQSKKRFLSNPSSDSSDSDWDEEDSLSTTVRRKKMLSVLKERRVHRQKSHQSLSEVKEEVQFEDPSWWRYLPSLKCIGLSCLLLEEYQRYRRRERRESLPKYRFLRSLDETNSDGRFHYFHGQAETALVSEVCQFYPRKYLRLLAECIGFSIEENSNGVLGDLSQYKEQKRLHILATRLLQERLQFDRHAIKFERLRTWGLLKPDATSIIIKDKLSGAHQLLTLGQPNVVTDFCTESWQGGRSIIIPFSEADRAEILENTKNWALADLDVTAFSYAPIPQSQEYKLEAGDIPEVSASIEI